MTSEEPVGPLMVVAPAACSVQSVALAVPPSSLITRLTRVSRADPGQDSVVANGNLWISRTVSPRVRGPWVKLAAITLPSMFCVGVQIQIRAGA